jgi:hypothetical protein
VRTIIFVFVSSLFVAMAVQSLEISFRHSVGQGVLADSQTHPGLVDNDSGEDHGAVEPSRYAR